MKWASNPIRELCVIPPPEPPCPGQVRAVRDGASRRYSHERWGEQGFCLAAPIVLFPPAPSAKLVSWVGIQWGADDLLFDFETCPNYQKLPKIITDLRQPRLVRKFCALLNPAPDHLQSVGFVTLTLNSIRAFCLRYLQEYVPA